MCTAQGYSAEDEDITLTRPQGAGNLMKQKYLL